MTDRQSHGASRPGGGEKIHDRHDDRARSRDVGRRDAIVKALRHGREFGKCGGSRLTPKPAASLKNHRRKHSSRATYYIDPKNLLHPFQQTRSERIQHELSSKARPSENKPHGGASLLSSGLCALASRQAAATEPQLEKAVQDGQALFVHETFGGAGNTCQTCHVEGGAGPGKSGKGDAIPSLANAQQLSAFHPKANKVETLEEKIGHCIAGALRGQPPAYGSEQITACQLHHVACAGQAAQYGRQAAVIEATPQRRNRRIRG